MGVYENFDEQKQFACRVIADHARTTAFAIADGILPGNEGRNYVLRKIMRRAIYHGREHLGFDGLFFHKVCDFVVGQMNDAYPELETQRKFIGKMVKLEEEKFSRTLSEGIKKFEERLNRFKTDLTELESLSKKITETQNKYLEENANNEENRSEKLKEITHKVIKEHVKKFGAGDNYDQVARLVMKHKIPPNDAKKMLDKSSLSDSWVGLFPSALLFIFAEEGSDADFDIARAFLNIPISSEEQKVLFLTYLNAMFNDLVAIYDTNGYPKDLIRVGLEDWGIQISDKEFNQEFEKAVIELQSKSNIGKTQQNEKINPIYKSLERQGLASNFHGYELTKVEDAKVMAIVKGDEKVDELAEGEEGLIVLDETPFYAESGGQVGDRGDLFNQNAQVKVIDTFAPIAGIVLHKSRIKSGSIKVGDVVTATVDEEKRDSTRRNHTATHLVHAALKEVLGTHVKQAGSVVSPNYLRFDFTHYQAMSDAEVQEIEDLVNLYILQNEPVATDLMSIDDAMKSGAVAMFGEKYGSDVRVLSVGGGEFSKELCGGTHVRATGDIGLFKITADEAIASGVRRIRAITGFDAFKRFRDDEILIDKSLNVLNTQRDNLPNAIQKLQEELKQKRREVDELKLKIATGAVGTSSNGDEAKEINGVKVFAKSVEDLDKGGMRHLSDTLMAKIKSGVVIIGNKNDGKVSFIVRVSDDLTDKVRAGNIIKEIAPIVGGKGGGKPDMAEGGGTEPEKLSEAMDASYGVIEKMLS